MLLIITTVLSLAIAVVMTFFAWRVVREDQRRSETRVSELAAEIRGEDRDPTPIAVNDLFAPDARPRTKGSLAHALAIGAFVVGSLIALAVVFSRDPTTGAAQSVARDGERQDSVAAAPARLPLELTALAHDRDGNDLNIRGIVHNPAGAASVGPLVAGVSAFNRQGELVATAKAPTERGTLEAGVESRFLVRMAGVGDVYRYRVSFTVDNRTVGHVDRRDQTVTAQLP